ncbi:colicin V processing peptidase. Cysteine peptidase. MEROPS family C39 [Andreprevotia lacus DSM 23236]|uniref:Cyclolysin secretion/processing ATP-binding protein CyaB n=1 Tax=Andreprevotia lacus DSM 23236 TaxID=1121001 RepID=A0A1W1XZ82_9NEIS|nr:peptidase domain-containing ABC transporter [Andreprevotia lacus]SMC29184.1 colicin V processing peptidase. Cysteine peptidase. MEROPS family C39 [Andreprevotia lacus DSM 23236]
MTINQHLDELAFGRKSELPLVYQAEASECGLACLAMVASAYGHRLDLPTLRQKFGISLSGSTISDLADMGSRLGMASRALRLDLEEMGQLQLPAILHWNFNHFVVLKSTSKKHIVIHDPAAGKVKLTWREASERFTGVALELTPTINFEAKEERQSIQLKKLIGEVRGLKRTVLKVMALAFCLEGLSLVTPFFSQTIIDNVLVTGDKAFLMVLGIALLGTLLLQQLFSTVRSWFLLYLNTIINLQWVANVFTHLVRLPVEFFERRHIGDIVSRFGAIHQIQETLTSSFVETVLDGLTSLALIAVMFLYSPVLATITLTVVVLYGIFRAIWYAPLKAANEKTLIIGAQQQTHFLETIRGVRSIKLFGKEDDRRSGWLNLSVDQINADLQTKKLTLLYNVVNAAVFGLHGVLILWLGANLVLSRDLSVGMLVAYTTYSGQFTQRFGGLIDRLFALRMLSLQCERLADIVLTEREKTESLIPLPADLKADLTIKGVHYRYAPQERDILKDCSFQVQDGESVALVGASGGGKTTLMKVALGILQPQQGEVLIGGIPIQKLGMDNLRKLVATVMQDDQLFSGSIEENITFFAKEPDRAWMEACAAMAGIHEQIMQMPMGYYSLVGDMGTVLSGGQKQRVLLARALYKRPRILILDEATSHLDVESEKAVNVAVQGLNITRLIIAHRPETIAMAGRIVMLKDGAALTRVPTAKVAELDLQ